MGRSLDKRKWLTWLSSLQPGDPSLPFLATQLLAISSPRPFRRPALRVGQGDRGRLLLAHLAPQLGGQAQQPRLQPKEGSGHRTARHQQPGTRIFGLWDLLKCFPETSSCYGCWGEGSCHEKRVQGISEDEKHFPKQWGWWPSRKSDLNIVTSSSRSDLEKGLDSSPSRYLSISNSIPKISLTRCKIKSHRRPARGPQSLCWAFTHLCTRIFCNKQTNKRVRLTSSVPGEEKDDCSNVFCSLKEKAATKFSP